MARRLYVYLTSQKWIDYDGVSVIQAVLQYRSNAFDTLLVSAALRPRRPIAYGL